MFPSCVESEDMSARTRLTIVHMLVSWLKNLDRTLLKILRLYCSMAPKAKQMISYGKLVQIGKEELKEPNQDLYCHDDFNVVVTSHEMFFERVAPHTKRLNPVSLANMARDLFKLLCLALAWHMPIPIAC